MEELLARLGLELAPELVRAAEERHVVGMLEVREADDPGEPVRGAALVKQVEALESEDAPAATREVVERCAPHPADSDDDDVVSLHPAILPGLVEWPDATAVENLGENRVRLTVDVSPDQVHHAVDHAMSDLSESVKIPGFRKGRSRRRSSCRGWQGAHLRGGRRQPHRRVVLERRVAQPRASGLRPQYEFELPDTPDDAWSFVATVEVQALPELVDWTQLEVPRAEVEVPQESVDAEIEALRESVAELAPAGDRPARGPATRSWWISSIPTERLSRTP